MAKVESVGVERSDMPKWLFVTLIVLACAVGNIYLADTYAWAVRMSVVIVFSCVALWVASTTVKGEIALKFIKEARLELKKIVWPTRQETTQTTLIVMVFVAVMSVLLWAMDSLFAALVSRIVG